MNIDDIREQYLAEINTRCSGCISKIDEILVRNYRRIEREGQIEIRQSALPTGSFIPSYTDDVVNSIKEHYAQNWNVIHHPEGKKKCAHFIFIYKPDSPGIAVEQKEDIIEAPEKIISEEIAKKQKNRFDMMDLE